MKTKILGVLSAVALVVSCGQSEKSKIEHAVGQIDRTLPPSAWISLSRAEISTLKLADVLIDSSHPGAMRLSEWVDAIDSSLRKRFPSRFLGIPPPRLYLNRETGGSPNAFVPGVFICANIALKSKQDVATTELPAVELGAPGIIVPLPIGDEDCAATYLSIETIAPIIDQFNKSPSACKLAIEGLSVSATDECFSKKYYNDGKVYSAKKIKWSTTANAVFLNTDVIKYLSEEEAIGILAHELGHYYQAHSSWFVLEEYAFVESAKGTASAPLKHREMEPLLQKTREASRFSLQKTVHTGAGQQIDSEYFGGLKNAPLTGFCDDDECDKVCKGAEEWSNHEFTHVGNFPKSLPHDPEFMSQYLEWEKRTLMCLDHFKLGSNKTKDFVSMYFSNAREIAGAFPDLTLDLDMPLRKIVTSASRIVRIARARQNFIFAKAAAARLGWYTAEQAADQIGVEILSYIGIPPTALRDVIVFWLNRESESACVDRYTQSDSKLGMELPGDYSDPHHSHCYRLFDLSRELQAHSYVVSPRPVLPLLDKNAWKNLNKEL